MSDAQDFVRNGEAFSSEMVTSIVEVLGSDKPLLANFQFQPLLDLFGIEDLDRLISVRTLRPPFIALVNSKKGIVPWSYSKTLDGISGSYAARSILQQLIDDGTTIVVQHAHLLTRSLHSFVGAIERLVIPRSVQCNAYLTPSKSFGVAAHADQHHTLLLQLSGEKDWKIWRSIDAMPNSPSIIASMGSAATVSSEESPILEVTLSAGQGLFIPRGYVHASQTGEVHSLHLTVGVVDPSDVSAAELIFRLQQRNPSELGDENIDDKDDHDILASPFIPIPQFEEIL